jgi:hypothetical protein
MLSKLAYNIFIIVVCTAIGRGIVSAFGLDARIARMISDAKDHLPHLGAIAWGLSGAFGLVCLVGWQIFHVSDTLRIRSTCDDVPTFCHPRNMGWESVLFHGKSLPQSN